VNYTSADLSELNHLLLSPGARAALEKVGREAIQGVQRRLMEYEGTDAEELKALHARALAAAHYHKEFMAALLNKKETQPSKPAAPYFT
jgi:hypothetical protein